MDRPSRDDTEADTDADPIALAAAWPVDTMAVARFDRSGQDLGGTVAHRFALASVTKPLFALAVLVAIEEGTLDLDTPVSRDPAPVGTTVRHLLAHASGLPFDEGGPIGTVGSRRIYSNVGFDLLGVLLSERSGMSAADYLDLAVCRPLGMGSTALVGSPARDAVSTVSDLTAFGRELLSPTLVDPRTMAEATTPQFPDLSGLLPGFGRQSPNPWGLGFEIKGAKSPHWTGSRNSPRTFGHFGQSGTMLWVDPELGAGAVALTDRPFGSWAIEAWPAFADAVVDRAIRTN